MSQIRSYHVEYTASHQNCEVKRRWAYLVLRWGTTWERYGAVSFFVFVLFKFFWFFCTCRPLFMHCMLLPSWMLLWYRRRSSGLVIFLTGPRGGGSQLIQTPPHPSHHLPPRRKQHACHNVQSREHVHLLTYTDTVRQSQIRAPEK